MAFVTDKHTLFIYLFIYLDQAIVPPQGTPKEDHQKEAPASGLLLEHCSEEHNYSLSQGGEPTATDGVQEEAQPQREEAQQDQVDGEGKLDEEDEDEEEEEEEDEDEELEEETAADLSSSSETECGEFFFVFFLEKCPALCPFQTSDHVVYLTRPSARARAHTEAAAVLPGQHQQYPALLESLPRRKPTSHQHLNRAEHATKHPRKK